MSNIPKIFACKVFDEREMRRRLPPKVYSALQETISEGQPLGRDIADIVAAAMRDWALNQGATHYTHWFQPMTGVTAEKHDSFITPDGHGNILMEFSGKELIRGEPDASSFPNGGLRATFEARGYTAWDPTSFSFICEDTLCIPTAFCSYSGEALDKKTPLLRSMETLDKQARRILRLFGNDHVTRVITTVGAEQEYFLIDKDVYSCRPDLVQCGRTLFGARPPKGQELEDHYFGSLRPRVHAFMKELDEELWKLGICSKTRHNEVAPSQHELAPIFTTVNIAADHNQLIMETMARIADRHHLACLLHEKPFAGVNGSGKHNNWSITTSDGVNLLDPGDTPHENLQFLLFFTAVIRAVDEFQDLLRLSVASAGNDHRLGAQEAPPAIISIYLGDEMTGIMNSLRDGISYEGLQTGAMESGATVLPHFKRDTTDRNRTSPFAFTGNRFEFRMPGSSCSISCANMILNTITADVLCDFADILESSLDFHADLNSLLAKTIHEHQRIIYNGNNYSNEWVQEANRRGLSNLKTTPDALIHYLDKKNVDLFARHNVLTKAEIQSRYEILMENYCKTLHIEALIMIDMTKREILPSVIRYQKELASLICDKNSLILSPEPELSMLQQLSSRTEFLWKKLCDLETMVLQSGNIHDLNERSIFYRDKIFLAMQHLRSVADELETLVSHNLWPYPTYAKMLYSV